MFSVLFNDSGEGADGRRARIRTEREVWGINCRAGDVKAQEMGKFSHCIMCAVICKLARATISTQKSITNGEKKKFSRSS